MVIQHLSRGSSEVWFTFPRLYTSAWSEDGVNTIRLVISGDYLVGALIMGDQTLADPLRYYGNDGKFDMVPAIFFYDYHYNVEE